MTIELPIKLKQRMAKGKFVIVGRAGMDLYPKPANKQTSEAGTFISDLGGSAANIAVSISKLGGRSQIITVVSDDEIGDFVWKKLKEHKYNLVFFIPAIKVNFYIRFFQKSYNFICAMLSTREY